MNDWMPVNPCAGCKQLSECERARIKCLKKEQYNCYCAAQRKLLEYLINLTDVIGYSVFTGQRAELLQNMLDKLEANNG